MSLAGLRCVAGWWDRSSGGLLGEAKKAEERKAAQWKAVKPVEKQVRIHPTCGCHTGCKAFGGSAWRVRGEWWLTARCVLQAPKTAAAPAPAPAPEGE